MIEQRLKYNLTIGAAFAMFAVFCAFSAPVQAANNTAAVTGNKTAVVANKIAAVTGNKIAAVTANKTAATGNKTAAAPISNIDKLYTQNDDGILTCSGFKCPRGTNKCIVYQTTKRNLKFIDTIVRCLSEKNVVLDKRESEKPNTDGTVHNDYVEMDTAGGVWSCLKCEGSSPEEISEIKKKEKKQ